MSDPFITPPTRLSADRLSTFLENLDEKSASVLRLLDDFHYALGSQIQRLFFVDGSELANIRARNRLLKKLSEQHLLHRYPRERLPGKKHGSTEFMYALAHAGQRLMNELREHERPQRSLDRTTNHFKHALAVTELHVCMSE